MTQCTIDYFSMVHNKLNLIKAMVRKLMINGGTNGQRSIATGKITVVKKRAG